MMWGRPNSVTMVASSAQMATDVELANFLTRKYFEKTSATIRKSILSNRICLLLMCAMGKGEVPE